jgi:hypothetical protein
MKRCLDTREKIQTQTKREEDQGEEEANNDADEDSSTDNNSNADDDNDNNKSNENTGGEQNEYGEGIFIPIGNGGKINICTKDYINMAAEFHPQMKDLMKTACMGSSSKHGTF